MAVSIITKGHKYISCGFYFLPSINRNSWGGLTNEQKKIVENTNLIYKRKRKIGEFFFPAKSSGLSYLTYLYQKSTIGLKIKNAHIVISFQFTAPLFPLEALSKLPWKSPPLPLSLSLDRSAMAASNSIFNAAPSRNLACITRHQPVSPLLSLPLSRSRSVAFRPKRRSSSLVLCSSTDESKSTSEKEIPIELSSFLS